MNFFTGICRGFWLYYSNCLWRFRIRRISFSRPLLNGCFCYHWTDADTLLEYSQITKYCMEEPFNVEVCFESWLKELWICNSMTLAYLFSFGKVSHMPLPSPALSLSVSYFSNHHLLFTYVSKTRILSNILIMLLITCKPLFFHKTLRGFFGK